MWNPSLKSLTVRFPVWVHLRTWAHTLGYRGHILAKSRKYSTTYAAHCVLSGSATRNKKRV